LSLVKLAVISRYGSNKTSRHARKDSQEKLLNHEQHSQRNRLYDTSAFAQAADTRNEETFRLIKVQASTPCHSMDRSYPIVSYRVDYAYVMLKYKPVKTGSQGNCDRKTPIPFRHEPGAIRGFQKESLSLTRKLLSTSRNDFNRNDGVVSYGLVSVVGESMEGIPGGISVEHGLAKINRCIFLVMGAVQKRYAAEQFTT
jgi:hypothetical protein